jgi:hypothetical protein
MLRGFIERVTPELISGWLYAESVPLRDRRVLAMLDGTCVAVGRIAHFRQDLADAGLGDGVLGFHFPLPSLASEDLPRLTIRLEGGDTDLLQAGARLERADATGGAALGMPLAELGDAALRWMRGRGWLTPTEEDALRTLRRFGVHELPLEGDTGATGRQRTAEAYCGLLAAGSVSLECRDLVSVDEVAVLAAQIALERDPAVLPVLVLWCAAAGRLGVAEASHSGAAVVVPGGREALADYEFGPDRLLFLHAACRFAARPRTGGGPIELITARLQAEPKGGSPLSGRR